MLTTEALLQAFERDMRSWNASERTITERVGMAHAFLHGRDMAAITPSDVTAWLSRPHLSPWSRCTYHGHLQALFSWALGEHLVQANPMATLRRPRNPRGNPRPLREDELALVMSTSHGHLRTWLVLAAYAGLRAHEIAKIRGEDVDEQLLFVLGKGRQEAYIPTHPALWAEAAAYPRHGWWFPSTRPDGHVTSGSVTNLTTRHFKAHEVDGSIHRLRHTYGTRLLRGGTNIRVVQTLMRHASLATTALYTAVDEDERRDAVIRLSA